MARRIQYPPMTAEQARAFGLRVIRDPRGTQFTRYEPLPGRNTVSIILVSVAILVCVVIAVFVFATFMSLVPLILIGLLIAAAKGLSLGSRK